jgi:hypothetical protein
MALLSRRAIVGMVLVAAIPASAQNASPRKEKRVVIRGYDPVGYFTDGRPIKGVPEFTADFDDMSYWFASATHRDMFVWAAHHGLIVSRSGS